MVEGIKSTGISDLKSVPEEGDFSYLDLDILIEEITFQSIEHHTVCPRPPRDITSPLDEGNIEIPCSSSPGSHETSRSTSHNNEVVFLCLSHTKAQFIILRIYHHRDCFFIP